MATIKQRPDTGAWQLQWRENGKQKRKTIGRNKQEAIIALKAKELELETGKPITSLHGYIFSAYMNEYLDWHEVEYPDSHYRIRQIAEQHLKPFFQNFPLNMIKIRVAEQYKIDRLKDGVKRATVVKELRTLKAMLNKAWEWEHIDFNPIYKLKMPTINDSKEPRFYTEKELESIYQFSPYNWWYWRLYANTGIRRGESLHIQRRWIGMEAMKIESMEDERTKSGKWREIPLNDSAKMAIERFNSKEKYLLPRVAPQSISRAFKRVINRASVAEPKGSLHCLRHTFCSHLVMDGKPLRLVQKLAGHSTIRVTEQYSHLDPGFISERGLIKCL